MICAGVTFQKIKSFAARNLMMYPRDPKAFATLGVSKP
jgi:hypothetical protein